MTKPNPHPLTLVVTDRDAFERELVHLAATGSNAQVRDAVVRLQQRGELRLAEPSAAGDTTPD